MRRAFTLLELVLAVSMASMVAVGAFGVLNMINRGDATLETRSVHVREMATLHGLLQEAFGTLVMSDSERPNTNVGGESLDQDLEQLMEFDPDEQDTIRPRMILRPDPSELAFAREARHTAQRFELVLRDGIASYNAPEELSDLELDRLERGREAIRGVLELRPEGDAWALWWRPVDEQGLPIRADHESNRKQNAKRLCGGLTSCLWKVFYRGQRATTFQATWSNDLPAYLEVEIATTTGLYANWVFEIGWSIASERVQVNDADPSEQGAGAAGTSGAGDVTTSGDGAQGTRRGSRPSTTRSGGSGAADGS